jgi:hypothetical protein
MTPAPASTPTDAAASSRWRARAILCAMITAGLALTVRVFYPGIMTYDAYYVYQDIGTGRLGDWQSPIMTVLWAAIDPIAPGSGSMFLLTAALYWLGFGILALAIARHRPRLALVVPVLALAPPSFILLGMIWRDILFAAAWLLAATLAYAVAEHRAAIRRPLQTVALVLLATGVLLRPNALLAAPILGVYLMWPANFSWRRAALTYVPAVIALYAMIQVVYYDVLGALRQNPLHSLIVFDLGGITHFSKQNQFPVTWTPEQDRLLTTSCYSPRMWDVYWYEEPCLFVMDRIEKQEQLFGTPALARAWRTAVIAHPLAYLTHRADVFWNLLAGDNLVARFYDLDDADKVVRADDSLLQAVKTLHDALEPTPVFRVGAWLIVCLGVAAAGWRGRATPAGAFALGVCGSAAAYVLSYGVFAVAVDFRYGYWAVLAALAGAITHAARPTGAD